MRIRVTPAIYNHRSLLAILLIFLILATFYNLSLPLYESPDEHAHFIYANWLAEGHGLPNLEQDVAKASHEIGQPPLYYALLALFIAPIDTSNIDTVAPQNPYFRDGGSINVHYHMLAERFPYRDTALAVHLARFVSTVMATVTIAATYGLARLIIPGQAALAAALVAFNPQFIFIAAAISNDTLVAALSALTLLVLVWIVTSAGPVRWRSLILGALWGLSVLAKASALGLGLVIALGLLLKARWRRSWAELIKGVVGLYDPYSGRRLTALRPNGAQWPDGVVALGELWSGRPSKREREAIWGNSGNWRELKELMGQASQNRAGWY